MEFILPTKGLSRHPGAVQRGRLPDRREGQALQSGHRATEQEESERRQKEFSERSNTAGFAADPSLLTVNADLKLRMPFGETGRSHAYALGGPSLALPNGYSDGLPLGMQIAGRANDEAMVYRVAYAYEQATRWSERHPTL